MPLETGPIFETPQKSPSTPNERDGNDLALKQVTTILQTNGFYHSPTYKQKEILADFLKIHPELFTELRAVITKYTRNIFSEGNETHAKIEAETAFFSKQVKNILDDESTRSQFLSDEKILTFKYSDWRQYFGLLFGDRSGAIMSGLMKYHQEVHKGNFHNLPQGEQLRTLLSFFGEDIYRVLDSGFDITLGGNLHFIQKFLDSTGTHTPFLEILSQGLKEIPTHSELLSNAILSNVAYNPPPKNSGIPSIGLPKGAGEMLQNYEVFENFNGPFGFSATVFHDKTNPKKMTIVFRGSDKPNDWILNNIPLALKGKPLQIQSVNMFLQSLEKKLGTNFTNTEFDITGHSLGGALAELMRTRYIQKPLGMNIHRIISFDSPGIKVERNFSSAIPHYAVIGQGMIGNHLDHSGAIIPMSGKKHSMEAIIGKISQMKQVVAVNLPEIVKNQGENTYDFVKEYGVS